MRHYLMIKLLLLCSVGLAQRTIVDIGFDKADSSLVFKYFEYDVHPMSQTIMDTEAKHMNLYYGDTSSAYRAIRKGMSFVEFYGGLSRDSLKKHEVSKGNAFLVMDIIKLVNFLNEKVYQNAIVYYKLDSPIEKGKRYKCSLSYYGFTAFTNITVNGFGFLFTNYQEPFNTNEYILKEPHVYSKDLLKIEENKWQYLEGEFIADNDYDCLLIGFFEPTNIFKMKEFYTKSSNNPEIIKSQAMRLSIDDVRVIELE